jgi:hypothetical protein
MNAVQSQPDSTTRPVLLPRNGQESLVTALFEVPDPRDARGIRHWLAVDALGLIIVVMVTAASVTDTVIGPRVLDRSSSTPRRSPGRG